VLAVPLRVRAYSAVVWIVNVASYNISGSMGNCGGSKAERRGGDAANAKQKQEGSNGSGQKTTVGSTSNETAKGKNVSSAANANQQQSKPAENQAVGQSIFDELPDVLPGTSIKIKKKNEGK
jgi:hypothetical protein